MCVSCLNRNMILNSYSNVKVNTNNDEGKNISVIMKEGSKFSLNSGSSGSSSSSSSNNNNRNNNNNNTINKTKTAVVHDLPTIKIETSLTDKPRKRNTNLDVSKHEEKPENKMHFLAPPIHQFQDLPSDFLGVKKMKRSFSFGGFGVSPSFGGMTSQEIESMFDPVLKKEPSKTSKKQIKEYAQKYKHLKGEENKKLPWYRDPLEYTQPAHLVTCIAFVYLAFRLFPDSRRSPTEASTLTRLLYVSSVSTVFGAQFWMTFVSGLALFFSVPRHTFAKVQEVLFPLYFLINAVLMMVAIVTYTQHRPTHLWDNHQMIQGGILVFGFIINFGIRIYLAPILTKLITIKLAIESEAGLGAEIGSNQPGVLSRCPHYMRLYKAFRKTHIIIAVGNMASMAGTSFHLYYLATKICSSYL